VPVAVVVHRLWAGTPQAVLLVVLVVPVLLLL
jgi:hypothetical protein